MRKVAMASKSLSVFLSFSVFISSNFLIDGTTLYAGGPSELGQQLNDQLVAVVDPFAKAGQKTASTKNPSGALFTDKTLSMDAKRAPQEEFPFVIAGTKIEMNGRVRTTNNGIIVSGVSVKNFPPGSYLELEVFSEGVSKGVQSYDLAKNSTNLTTYIMTGLTSNTPASFNLSVKQNDAQGKPVILTSYRSKDYQLPNTITNLATTSWNIQANGKLIVDDYGNLTVTGVSVNSGAASPLSAPTTVEIYEMKSSGPVLAATQSRKIYGAADFSFSGLTPGASYSIVIKAERVEAGVIKDYAEYRKDGIVMPKPVVISPVTMPDNMRVGESVSFTLAATGGSGTYSWSIKPGGFLPAGLTLSKDGVISGIPTSAISNQGTPVVVIDSKGRLANAKIVFNILPATLSTGPAQQVTASVGTPVNITLPVSGGTGPYTWTISTGSLPAGLTLSADGIVSGIPSEPVNRAVIFQVQSADGQIATMRTEYRVNALPLVILAPAKITLTQGIRTLPLGGDPVKILEVDSEGGYGPRKFWIDGGDLETGYDLNELGIGSYYFSSENFLNRDSKPTLFINNFDANRNPVLPYAATVKFFINVSDGHQITRKEMTIEILPDPTTNDNRGATISTPVPFDLNSRSNAFEFTTDEKTKASIYFGTNPTDLNIQTDKSEYKTNHRIVLDQLRPETNYYYKIVTRDIHGNITESEVRKFTTNGVETADYGSPYPLETGRTLLHDDAATLFLEDLDINVTVLSNDELPANQRYIKIVGQPANGRVRANPNLTINFLANANAVPGTDTFSYQVCTGPNTGCSPAATVTIKLEHKPVMPEVVLRPNLYRGPFTEPSTGTKYMRIAYEIKNAGDTPTGLILSGMINRTPNYESGGIGLINAFGEGAPREVKDGVFYADVALGDYQYCGVPATLCTPSQTRFVPYDPNFEYTLSVNLRPANGVSGGQASTGIPVYGSLKTGSQSQVRVQLGNENIILESNGSANFRPELRCFSAGCPQYGANFFSDNYSIPSGAFTSGYGTMNRTGFTAGTTRSINISLSDYVRSGSSGGGWTYTSNFGFNVSLTAQPTQVASVQIANSGNLVSNGFGATLNGTMTGGTPNTLTLYIYSPTNPNQIIYTVTTQRAANGSFAFHIPISSNGVSLLGTNLQYMIDAGGTPYPAPNTRASLYISGSGVVNASVSAVKTYTNTTIAGNPAVMIGAQFNGTIPGFYQANQLAPGRYRAVIVMTYTVGGRTITQSLGLQVGPDNTFTFNLASLPTNAMFALRVTDSVTGSVLVNKPIVVR